MKGFDQQPTEKSLKQTKWKDPVLPTGIDFTKRDSFFGFEVDEKITP